MAWLGVNFNEGLSTIKGQITNFTKDVLADDAVEDENEQILVPRKQIKELESAVYIHKQEVTELRRNCDDYLDRLRASELSSTNVNSYLKHQLAEAQEELRHLKEKSVEWNWESNSDGVGPVSHADGSKDTRERLLADRITLLERELLDERQKHKDEILAIQEAHRAEISRGATANPNDSQLLHRQSGDETNSTSGLPKKQCQCEVHEVRISELEEKLASLTVKYNAVSEEKSQLEGSLEELDEQHQEIVDELLKSRKKLVDELNAAKESLISSEAEVLKLNESLLGKQTRLHELENQAQSLKQQSGEGISCLEKRLDDLLAEKNDISAARDAAEHKFQSANNAVEEIYRTINRYEDTIRNKDGKISQLELELETERSTNSSLYANLESSYKQLEASHIVMGQFTALQQEYAELEKERNDTIGENKILLEQLNDGETKLATQSQSLKNLEQQLTVQQEEILKYEAVLEEKTIEYCTTLARLKQLEDVNKTLSEEFEREKGDLLLRIKDLDEKCLTFGERKKEGPISSSSSSVSSAIQQMLHNCNVENVEDLAFALSEMRSEIASLRCERDRLSEDFAAASQELKDCQELLEVLEVEKGDVERECEDLRDQVEELQCGGRQSPEGSLTPRSLPTIEEEDIDICTNATEVTSENKTADEELLQAVGIEDRTQFMEQISHLNTQVAALTEARQNLEVELCSVRNEKTILEQRLSEINGQLGNLANLEVEAATLRNKNESLIGQLNDTHNQLKTCSNVQEEKHKLSLQVQQMTSALDKMSFDSSQLLFREEEYLKEQNSLRDHLCMKDKQIHEYFHEITGLKKQLSEQSNSSVVIRDHESNILPLQEELDKVKGLIIYKDDHIDLLSQTVKGIARIFALEEVDHRNMYSAVKTKYDSLVDKIASLTIELTKVKEDSSPERLKEIEEMAETQLKIKNIELSEQYGDIKVCCDNLEASIAKNTLLTKENFAVVSDLSSARTRIGQLESELENTKALHEASLKQLWEAKETGERVLYDEIYELTTDSETQLNEITALKQQVADLISAASSENSSVVLQLESLTNEKLENEAKLLQLSSELLRAEEALTKAGEERDELKKELDFVKQGESKLQNDSEDLSKQLLELHQERQQLIAMSTQKHQESVSYYTEIQRLSQVIQMEKQKATEMEATLQTQLTEKCEELLRAQNGLKNLNVKVVELQSRLVTMKDMEHAQSSARNEVKLLQEELRRNNEELTKQQELGRSMQQERDQLRLANSSFNSQYEDQSKELSALQEKERYLSQECSRLKQHLVEIEETYTNEAVQSEQRETSLRNTIAKLHEKMASHSSLYSSTKEKNSAQLESLQKQLLEAVHQRDEAVQQLHASVEASLQHQESLTRLQQVLQDFQKGQVRDIAQATEREKRKYEEERQKNNELETELQKLKEKLSNAETNLLATKTLREDLHAKDDTIIALKSQVQSVQLAAKKSQEQVALLQTSSDAKVDKHLLRNLTVGYFATPSDKRREVLHIIAQVLDFSIEERMRSGIDSHSGSWLSSIANFLAPPPSNIRVASRVDVLDHTSLSQAFIRFLEEESSPLQQPRLPAVQMAEEAHQKAQKKAQVKAVYKTNPLFGGSETEPRNTTSPLFAAPMPSSLSNLQPVISSQPEETQHGSSPVAAQPSQHIPVNAYPASATTEASINGPPSSNQNFHLSEEISETKFLSSLLNSEDNKIKDSST